MSTNSEMRQITAAEAATELCHLGKHDWASHTERNGVSATLVDRLSEDLQRHNEQRAKTKPNWLRELPDRWAPRAEALINRLQAS